MEYEDLITIWAPEGLALEYTLAGVGSRFIAELLDVALRVAALGALIGLLAIAGVSSTVLLIVLLVGTFLALFGYDIAFEVWAGGRTPGKRSCGLRVLMASGQPVSFGSSAVRNLMRIIDIWATAGTVGILSILLTKRDQRLGDLAAGTIVVRERRARLGGPRVVTPDASPLPAASAPTLGIDVTAVTAAELSAIRDFLARRDRLSSDARTRVAQALAQSLSSKVGGLPPWGLAPEQLLETIAAAKANPRYGSARTP